MRCPCHVPALVALVAAALSACAPTAALMTPPPSMKPPAGQANESTGEVAFSAGGMGSAVTYGPWNLKGDGIGLAYAGGAHGREPGTGRRHNSPPPRGSFRAPERS